MPVVLFCFVLPGASVAYVLVFDLSVTVSWHPKAWVLAQRVAPRLANIYQKISKMRIIIILS